jgi:SAM-dependent methyltransferase
MSLNPLALAFDAAAGAYVRGRPDYPVTLLDWLAEKLRLGPGQCVADLGAGTGKFTRLLLRTGARVIAIEPVHGMRAALAAELPAVEALEGLATAIPLPDQCVQALTCAQAFHWFASVEALAEIRRVLAPGGRLGLVWNVRDDRTPWVAKLTRLLDAFEGDAPRHASGEWREVFPAEGFGPLHEDVFAHGHTGDPEDVIVQRVVSTSFIADLPDAERARVVDQVRAIIAADPALAGRAEVTVPYVTRAYWAERT